MKHFLSFIIAVLVTFPIFAQSQADTTSTKSTNKRPKVGLALAGGGAKGSAHIGALKYIQEIGIPIDYVTGTSMGSIMGGLTALGYTADEMGEIIRSMDWSMYMSNSTEYYRLGYKEKQDKNKYIIRVSAGDGTLNKLSEVDTLSKDESIQKKVSLINTLPSAFINGASLLNLFNNLAVGYQDSLDFKDLPVPFACVTLDLASRNPNVISSGNIGEAIRASMAIPGLFAPVRTNDGKVLVDGGLVNNFPVDICREMGADIVIGLEVNPYAKNDPDALKSLPGVLSQLLSYETRHGLEENRQNCDIYIHPSTVGYGTMSFDAESVDTLIMRGYNEAAKHRDELLALKNLIDGYKDQPEPEIVRTVRFIEKDSVILNEVQVYGLDNYESRKIEKLLSPLLGHKIVVNDIEKAMLRFYGLRCFNSITYNVLGKEEPYTLAVHFDNASPHHLGVGLRYDTDAAAALLLSAGYNTNKLRGFSAELSTRLSYSPYLKASLGFNGGIYTKGNLDYTFAVPRFPWTYINGASCRLTLMTHQVKLYLSDANYKQHHFQLGVKFDQYIERENLTIDGIFDSLNFFKGKYLSAFANYNVNTTNDGFFPTKGIKLGISGQYTPNVFKNEYASNKAIIAVQGNLNVNIPFSKRVVFEPSLHFRFTDHAMLIGPMHNFVGGEEAGRYLEQQLPFVGINRVRDFLDNVAIVRADLRVQVLPKLYVSGIFNYMRYSIFPVKDIFSENYYDLMGAGIKCAVNTFIGPVSLTINWSDYSNSKSKVGAYFSVGHYF